MPAWHRRHSWTLRRGQPDNSVFDLTSIDCVSSSGIVSGKLQPTGLLSSALLHCQFVTASFISGSLVSFRLASCHFISLHSFMFDFISLHAVVCRFISFRLASLHFISLHYISFHFITLHFTSFHFISFHFISFHFISFHGIAFHVISFLIPSCVISWHVAFLHLIPAAKVRQTVATYIASMPRHCRLRVRNSRSCIMPLDTQIDHGEYSCSWNIIFVMMCK